MHPDTTHPSPEPLRRGDFLILAVFSLIVFGIGLIIPKTLNIHETVGCVNTREMIANGDLVIPTYGERPWLERPPLPFWLTAATVIAVDGVNTDWAYRIAPIIAGLIGVLLTGWIGAMAFGRAIGLMSGCILATSFEYFMYAKAPESDIFLACFVIAAMAMFTRAELGSTTASDDIRFWGKRRWPVLVFFIFLGMTNLTKGLIFGTLHVLAPVTGFLLVSMSIRCWLRYIWLWGWLAFLVVGGAWALAAYLRMPDIMDLWHSDYIGRLKEGAFPQPWWYYLANLPGAIAPWTPLAFVGLWLTRPASYRLAERLIWCWAILPIALFSFADGKHHHYLLPCVPAWAILSAMGARRVWQRFKTLPNWMQNPLIAGVVSAVILTPLVIAFARKIPGPEWKVPAVIVGGSITAMALCWAWRQSSGRVAFGVTVVVAMGMQWLVYAIDTYYLDKYREDMEFVQKANDLVPADASYFVLNDVNALYASWFIHYTDGRTAMLHNESFLIDDRITAPEIFVIARAKAQSELNRYGVVEVVLQSTRTRGELSPSDRFTLFRLRFRDDLVRKSANIHISPMQATGRWPGPVLQ